MLRIINSEKKKLKLGTEPKTALEGPRSLERCRHLTVWSCHRLRFFLAQQFHRNEANQLPLAELFPSWSHKGFDDKIGRSTTGTLKPTTPRCAAWDTLSSNNFIQFLENQ